MSAQNAATQSHVDLLHAAMSALQRRDIEACVAMMDPDFIINIAGMPYQKRGTGAWRKNIDMMLSAFPDVDIHVEDVVASGDRVALRVRFTGTHSGEFLGMQPTGKKIDYLSHELYRVEGGRIVEEWICSDMMTLMTQIGAFPSGRLVLMWLAGKRTWFALATGIVAGAVAVSVPRLRSEWGRA